MCSIRYRNQYFRLNISEYIKARLASSGERKDTRVLRDGFSTSIGSFLGAALTALRTPSASGLKEYSLRSFFFLGLTFFS